MLGQINTFSDDLRCDDEIVDLDLETDGLDPFAHRPFALGLGLRGRVYAARWTPELARWLNRNLPRARVVSAFNAKFDLHMLAQGGIKMSVLHGTNVYCSMITEILLDEHRDAYDLDSTAKRRLGRGKINKGGLLPHQMPWGQLVEYLAEDVRLAGAVRKAQGPEIEAQGLSGIHQIEMQAL